MNCIASGRFKRTVGPYFLYIILCILVLECQWTALRYALFACVSIFFLYSPFSSKKRDVRKISWNGIEDGFDVLIIGAGFGGLASAACLLNKGVSKILVLESEQDLGEPWRKRYDRLHLHTDKHTSTFPFMDWPGDTPLYPSKDQVVNYIRSYQKLMNIPVQFHTRVTHVEERVEGGWKVTAIQEGIIVSYNTNYVIIAIGENAEPFNPTLPLDTNFKGTIQHSASYKNGHSFLGKNVLVVGCGNSGMEIALELYECGAFPSLVVRSEQLIAARDTIPNFLSGATFALTIGAHFMPDWLVNFISYPFLYDLSKYGIKSSRVSITQSIKKLHRSPILDLGTVLLIKTGKCQIFPGIKSFHTDGETVHFEDDRQACFEAVIKATGFKSMIAPLFSPQLAKNILDDNGKPLLSGYDLGCGLFFVGYADSWGRFREMSFEAERISRALSDILLKNWRE